jgi:hypothetical protein
MQLELSLYLTANQGLIISATQLMGIAGDNGVCFFSGLVVLMVPTGFLLIVWFLLFQYVRPSSRAAKVRWNEMEGEWALAPVSVESDPDGEPSGESEDVGSPDKDVIGQQSPKGAQGQQSSGRKRSTRRGKGRIKVRARRSGACEDEEADGAHDFDANGVKRSRAARMLASMRWIVRQSSQTEFHVLVEPLLEGWHNKRLAWVGPALLLGVEYGIGLAMGFGALASCESEQVVKP